AIEKLVHALTAQGDAAADGHAAADLEVGDGLLGAGDDRALAGNLTELNSGNVEQLDVLAGFTEADIDDNLGDPRNGHGIFVPEGFMSAGIASLWYRSRNRVIVRSSSPAVCRSGGRRAFRVRPASAYGRPGHVYCNRDKPAKHWKHESDLLSRGCR